MPDPSSDQDAVSPRDILLLGAGHMGGALLRGWLASSAWASGLRIHVIEPMPGDWLLELAGQGRVELITDRAQSLPKTAQLAILAVKPQLLDEAVAPLRPLAAAGVPMMSIAAGRSITALQHSLGGFCPLIRAMPNTPMAIGRGVSVCTASKNVDEETRAFCTRLLEAGGPVFWVEDEALIDVVTAVSGSGPAYVFHMAECLAAAGAKAGLDPALATELARLTVAGAGALLWPDEADATALRKAVTSPGGTTAAALAVLGGSENGGNCLAGLMEETVAAALRRARELNG